MKKRILIVIESLNCGGAEKSLVSLLPLLDYNKYDIDLLIHNIGGGMFEHLVDERVNILPQLDFVKFCKRHWFYQVTSMNFKFLIPRIKWFVSIHMKKNKARHAADVYWESCNAAFDILPQTYDVAIAWGQGHATHFVADKVNAIKKYAWINANYIRGNHDKAFDEPYYRKMDKIITVSDELLKITKDVFPEYSKDMGVIYDVINYDLIRKMAEYEDVLSDVRCPIIITIGRLSPQKNHVLAVEACKILREHGIDFVWYNIGEGSERRRLEYLIHQYKLEDTFMLLGAKENPYCYLKKADLYVQTSAFEGYCITLAEARLFNKPIVTTNFDVVNDQIKNEYNGLVVQMTAEAVAAGIERVLKDTELRNRFIYNLNKEKKGNMEEVLKFMELLDE